MALHDYGRHKPRNGTKRVPPSSFSHETTLRFMVDSFHSAHPTATAADKPPLIMQGYFKSSMPKTILTVDPARVIECSSGIGGIGFRTTMRAKRRKPPAENRLRHDDVALWPGRGLPDSRNQGTAEAGIRRTDRAPLADAPTRACGCGRVARALHGRTIVRLGSHQGRFTGDIPAAPRCFPRAGRPVPPQQLDDLGEEPGRLSQGALAGGLARKWQADHIHAHWLSTPATMGMVASIVSQRPGVARHTAPTST